MLTSSTVVQTQYTPFPGNTGALNAKVKAFNFWQVRIGCITCWDVAYSSIVNSNFLSV